MKKKELKEAREPPCFLQLCCINMEGTEYTHWLVIGAG